MKKIIITGATGMLGTAITNALQGHDLYGYSSKELDITCSFKLDQIVKSIKPDYIINCAAYTAVDLAETKQENAFKINALAVQKMAQVANQYQATLIHFSTDYVFNGTATQPYLPLQETDPINVYGASKLAGEKSIMQVNGKHYIFRISWLYAPHGKNFFKWVAGTDMNELKIVDSQTGSPTSALDVSSFIKHLVKNDPETYGVYHFTNQGAMTWFEFAIAINKKLNLDKIIHPVATFKTAAKRPTYSVMDGSDTIKFFNYEIPTVEKGLDEVVRIYNP
ncbi:dTDP-4-dehydrorhamnose reductase [Nonlabens sp. Asnod2-A12]|uniref:dTDP-4-dehydrorhamnose reductase n=1 Tax=Nonlabens sp. Asnod2-A12 TaxID=3160578 RepID=UPI00386F94F9